MNRAAESFKDVLGFGLEVVQVFTEDIPVAKGVATLLAKCCERYKDNESLKGEVESWNIKIRGIADLIKSIKDIGLDTESLKHAISAILKDLNALHEAVENFDRPSVALVSGSVLKDLKEHNSKIDMHLIFLTNLLTLQGIRRAEGQKEEIKTMIASTVDSTQQAAILRNIEALRMELANVGGALASRDREAILRKIEELRMEQASTGNAADFHSREEIVKQFAELQKGQQALVQAINQKQEAKRYPETLMLERHVMSEPHPSKKLKSQELPSVDYSLTRGATASEIWVLTEKTHGTHKLYEFQVDSKGYLSGRHGSTTQWIGTLNGFAAEGRLLSWTEFANGQEEGSFECTLSSNQQLCEGIGNMKDKTAFMFRGLKVEKVPPIDVTGKYKDQYGTVVNLRQTNANGTSDHGWSYTVVGDVALFDRQPIVGKIQGTSEQIKIDWCNAVNGGSTHYIQQATFEYTNADGATISLQVVDDEDVLGGTGGTTVHVFCQGEDRGLWKFRYMQFVPDSKRYSLQLFLNQHHQMYLWLFSTGGHVKRVHTKNMEKGIDLKRCLEMQCGLPIPQIQLFSGECEIQDMDGLPSGQIQIVQLSSGDYLCDGDHLVVRRRADTHPTLVVQQTSALESCTIPHVGEAFDDYTCACKQNFSLLLEGKTVGTKWRTFAAKKNLDGSYAMSGKDFKGDTPSRCAWCGGKISGAKLSGSDIKRLREKFKKGHRFMID